MRFLARLGAQVALVAVTVAFTWPLVAPAAPADAEPYVVPEMALRAVPVSRGVVRESMAIPEPDIAQEEPASAPEPTVEERLRAAARQFEIDEDQFVAVARCESGLRKIAVGDGGLARGVLQFHERTFVANAERYFGYPVGDMRDDVVFSATVGAYMFSIGQARQWTCARILGYD